MPQLGRQVRTGMMLFATAALAAACGQEVPRDATQAVAAVRLTVDQLARYPKWRDGAGRCLCVGLFRDEGVEDFPVSLLADMRARHDWVHNWSECAPYYGHKAKLKGCEAGKTDYVCMVVERSNLPPGTARVLCHAAGEGKAMQYQFVQDEFDVSEKDGIFAARPISQRALVKLYE